MGLIKMKKILINVIIMIVCFIISILLCMKVFDYIFMRVSSSNVGFMFLRIFLAVILFVIVKSVLNGELSSKEMNFAFIGYCLLIISLTLFKMKDLTVETGYNLNLLTIFEGFSTTTGVFMIAGNLLAYIPIAFYLKNKFNAKPTRFLIIAFIMYCIGIELIQYIFKFGIFDINDIVLNTLGFILGVYLYKFYQKNNIKKGHTYEKIS